MSNSSDALNSPPDVSIPDESKPAESSEPTVSKSIESELNSVPKSPSMSPPVSRAPASGDEGISPPVSKPESSCPPSAPIFEKSTSGSEASKSKPVSPPAASLLSGVISVSPPVSVPKSSCGKSAPISGKSSPGKSTSGGTSFAGEVSFSSALAGSEDSPPRSMPLLRSSSLKLVSPKSALSGTASLVSSILVFSSAAFPLLSISGSTAKLPSLLSPPKSILSGSEPESSVSVSSAPVS